MIDHLAYDAYGNLTSESSPSNGDRFKFNGMQFDQALDAYYDNARYYDPVTGRFLEEDPTGFAAQDPNLYRFVGNSPTNWTDPSGRIAISKQLSVGQPGQDGNPTADASNGGGSWDPFGIARRIKIEFGIDFTGYADDIGTAAGSLESKAQRDRAEDLRRKQKNDNLSQLSDPNSNKTIDQVKSSGITAKELNELVDGTVVFAKGVIAVGALTLEVLDIVDGSVIFKDVATGITTRLTQKQFQDKLKGARVSTATPNKPSAIASGPGSNVVGKNPTNTPPGASINPSRTPIEVQVGGGGLANNSPGGHSNPPKSTSGGTGGTTGGLPNGSKTPGGGNVAPNSVPSHIKNLGDDISRWLGKDAKAITNEAGDTIIQSADGLREIRFDFNHTYPHKNPHTHLIEYKMVKNKKVEITNRRIYPSGVTPE